MQTKLVLFEGNPFTGKSTLSEYAAQQLALNGHAVQWVSEGEMLDTYFPHLFAVMDQTEPLSEETLWAEWRAFAQAVQSAPAIFVVDAPISYAAVDPLLAEDQSPAAILEMVRRLAELFAPLHPRVIHLIGDQDRIVRASIAERGEKWEQHLVRQSDITAYQQTRGRSGVEGAILLFQETQDLMQAVLAPGGWPTLTLDVAAANRETNRRALLDFLGISEVLVTPPALEAALPAYTGTYTQDDPEEGTPVTIEVRLEGNRLALHQPGMRLGPLVPVSANRLHLTATPVDVEFEVAEGVAERLVLHWASGKTRAYHRTT